MKHDRWKKKKIYVIPNRSAVFSSSSIQSGNGFRLAIPLSPFTDGFAGGWIMYLEDIYSDRLENHLDLLKEDFDKKTRYLDRLREDFDKRIVHPRVEYKSSHPTITQGFFIELSKFLGDDKNVDLTYSLLRKYVLKK